MSRETHIDPAFWTSASREQRERIIADMPLYREPARVGEHPVVSLALWIAIAAIGGFTWSVFA